MYYMCIRRLLKYLAVPKGCLSQKQSLGLGLGLVRSGQVPSCICVKLAWRSTTQSNSVAEQLLKFSAM